MATQEVAPAVAPHVRRSSVLGERGIATDGAAHVIVASEFEAELRHRFERAAAGVGVAR